VQERSNDIDGDFLVYVFAENDTPVTPLEVGIVPYMSARVLISSYEPMRLYLEQALNRPVKIYTATGFKQFFLNAKHGDYDLVITASHFARILQKDYQYTPLVRFASVGKASIVTALNSPVKTLQDLRGQVIAVPDMLSLSTIVALSYLREIGMRPDIDYQLLEVPSFVSAILSVQKGGAVAAVSATGILTQMPREMGESVKTVLDTGEFLRNIFLINPHLDKKYADLIKHLLLKFGNETNEGKQFLTITSAGAIVPVTAKDMKSLDLYIAETKRLLSENP
jgi:phosphonate transport system substrate-binding protein